ncbi:asparagine synthase (glutamine-hydrolyzing) [Candidatus Uhrbacteria bacterium CG_4_9_14_0_2_um_filter_41_50]|uniref:asparagine synthase (glutamine-hydrolyzing) n=1 Tax=Candidatus Uhrbacteria bacterium CG_4_9_14_0_2_um_filter_41_50 TaxID=1975031 RepID=A0A2M8EN87_9BACT|nr:MAG: asparagine synthase (glutamine-hydrolyzing) [Candidatus Uhrbacteria bacterium CG_4_9_14_0_2_um_filter_41_50]
MCGISAIIGKNKQDINRLEKMLVPIAHRGEKKYFNESADFGTCVLGMNRLAIVDRERAKQPISSSDGRYHIVFNGEIYNYKELQNELKEIGCSFTTDSDTEVLVNGYATWGEKLLDKVSGMFAFFIYDSKENTFFAARDPFGVKPLYWAKDNDKNYYFASEIKSLVEIEVIKTVNLFPSGHFMNNGKLKKYFSIDTKIDENITEETAVNKIRELFDHSIKIRTQTDLPVAVYLSGGIDSTAVLATALKYHKDTTAIIVGNEQSTDRQIAVQYCEENSIKYIVGVPPTEEELAKTIPEIIRMTESFEPNMIRQSAVSYFIAKTAAEKGFKVILCGEGSDEIFAGYPEFMALNTAKEIEQKILSFLSDLHRTQLQRVDRTSMAFTTEVREPFLDKDLVKFVLTIPLALKVWRENGKVVSKYILRKAMQDRLPQYIYDREKVVLSEGAGFKGNQKVGGLFYDIVSKEISDQEFEKYKKDYTDWNLETKEEVYYFKHYLNFGYEKAVFNKQRTTVNKTDTQQNDTKLAGEILESFDTWQFKREQPKTEEKLLETILRSVRSKKPIEFVMYWGKGERDIIGEKEKEAILYLKKMLSMILEKYPFGSKVTLILTDTHAELNGHTKSQINQYFDSVITLARQAKFYTTNLSTLAIFDEQALMKKLGGEKISDELLNILVESSEKHCKKYNPDIGAKLYYLQNLIEKKEIEKSFSEAIFLTYNGNELDEIFPNKIPIFYMYSIKKGTSVKPWFDS